MAEQEKYYAFATVPVKEEYIDLAEQAILEIIPQTLAEEGCEVFTLHREYGKASPCLYLYEVFTSEAAFDFHHDQEYTKAVFKRYETWLSGEVDIKRLSRLE